MRNRWLLCVFLAALSWGQAAPGTPPAQPAQAPAPTAPAGQPTAPAPKPVPADAAASIPATAAVLTVKGICPPQPKAPAAKGTKAASAATSPAADCKTVITKSEFDLLLKAIPNAGTNPQVKRNIAARWPQFIAWSNEAKKKGLDKTPEFAEMMKFAKAQILASVMQQRVQEDAAKISDADLASYYKDHHDAYEQFNLERIFVPRSRQVEAAKEEKEEDEKDEKLTDEQQKAKQAEEKAKQEENMEAMTKLAESIRARAASGEDFTALQKEAFDAAGMKIASPNVAVPNQRRNNMSPSQASVFELKPGDVSEVINDAGGHYIYKLKSKEQLSLDQVKEEIRRTLTSQRSKEAVDKVNASFSVEKNDAYFGPDQAPVPFPQRMQNPRMAPPPNAPQPQRGPAPVQGGAPGQPPQPQQQAAPPAQPAQPPAAQPN